MDAAYKRVNGEHQAEEKTEDPGRRVTFTHTHTQKTGTFQFPEALGLIFCFQLCWGPRVQATMRESPEPLLFQALHEYSR